jgi:hypothetical protein
MIVVRKSWMRLQFSTASVAFAAGNVKKEKFHARCVVFDRARRFRVRQWLPPPPPAPTSCLVPIRSRRFRAVQCWENAPPARHPWFNPRPALLREEIARMVATNGTVWRFFPFAG